MFFCNSFYMCHSYFLGSKNDDFYHKCGKEHFCLHNVCSWSGVKADINGVKAYLKRSYSRVNVRVSLSFRPAQLEKSRLVNQRVRPFLSTPLRLAATGKSAAPVCPSYPKLQRHVCSCIKLCQDIGCFIFVLNFIVWLSPRLNRRFKDIDGFKPMFAIAILTYCFRTPVSVNLLYWCWRKIPFWRGKNRTDQEFPPLFSTMGVQFLIFIFWTFSRPTVLFLWHHNFSGAWIFSDRQ